MLSGGFDLKVMRSGAGAAGKLVTDGGALITRLFGSEVPVLIACPGHAVAAGALLLLGADERIGARGAFRIGLIETEIGLVLPRWAAELAARAAVAPPAPDRDGRRQDVRPRRRMRRPDSSTRSSIPICSRRPRSRRPPGGPSCPAGAYRGQVRMNRGDVLGRLPTRSRPTGAGPSTYPSDSPRARRSTGRRWSAVVASAPVSPLVGPVLIGPFASLRERSCCSSSSGWSSWRGPSTCCCGARNSGGSRWCARCRASCSRATTCSPRAGSTARVVRLGDDDAEIEIAPGTVMRVARGAIGQVVTEPGDSFDAHGGATEAG